MIGSTARGRTLIGLRAGAALVALTLASSAGTAAPPKASGFTPNHAFIGGYDNASSIGAIFEFDEAGAFVRKIPVTPGVGVFGVTFGPDGAIYCVPSTTNTSVVIRVDETRGVVTVLDPTAGLSSGARGVAFGPQGRLYVANGLGGNVIEADVADHVVNTYTAPANRFPQYVAFGPQGHVYVSEEGIGTQSDVEELDADLRFVRSFGGFPTAPSSVVFGRDGILYVVLKGQAGIARFGADGSRLADLPAAGLGLSRGAAAGPDGNLYVTDFGGHGAIVVDPLTGATVRTLSHPDLVSPAGIAFAPFRFQTKATGTLVSASFAKLAEPTAVVSFSPGSNMLAVSLTDGASSNDIISAFPGTDALVFHGNEALSADRRSFVAHGVAVGGHAAACSVGSMELVARGAADANGFFVPKSISGAIQLSRAGTALSASFAKGKRVP